MPMQPTGDAAAKVYRQQVSKAGVAKAHKEATAALNAKYPGMFLPETRTTAGVNKAKATPAPKVKK